MEDNKLFYNNKNSLEGAIEFSKDSIVSKTIIDKKSGTITLFAFDKGQKLSEHSTPYDAMVQIIDGDAKVIINKKINILNKGEVIIMPANIPHAINAKNRFKMLLIMIKEKIQD